MGIQRGGGVEAVALQMIRQRNRLIVVGAAELSLVAEACERVAIFRLGTAGGDVGLDQGADLAPGLQTA